MRYERTAQTGVGFETHEGGFFVKTLFRESAIERARQEFASGRDVVSATIYEDGKLSRILDWRFFSQETQNWDAQISGVGECCL